MRIIAGHLKGRRLNAPTWEGLRPTSDKLRETLFNILAPRVEVLDAQDGAFDHVIGNGTVPAGRDHDLLVRPATAQMAAGPRQ